MIVLAAKLMKLMFGDQQEPTLSRLAAFLLCPVNQVTPAFLDGLAILAF